MRRLRFGRCGRASAVQFVRFSVLGRWPFSGRSMLMNCSRVAHELATNWPGIGPDLAMHCS
eukprot:8911418-Lingulodinium_polyedra.AAC.1